MCILLVGSSRLFLQSVTPASETAAFPVSTAGIHAVTGAKCSLMRKAIVIVYRGQESVSMITVNI
jgi:hypothetical protein